MSTQTAASEPLVARPIPMPVQEQPAVVRLIPYSVKFPCTFPGCKMRFLTSDELYVPVPDWVYRQAHMGKSFDVSNPPTLEETVKFGRCWHHALESAVGLELNHRMKIRLVTLECNATILDSLKKHAAEKEAKRQGYRQQHEAEKEAARKIREAKKEARPSGPGKQDAAEPSKPKNYGDWRKPVVEESSTKRHKKGASDNTKKGGKNKGSQRH